MNEEKEEEKEKEKMTTVITWLPSKLWPLLAHSLHITFSSPLYLEKSQFGKGNEDLYFKGAGFKIYAS